MSEETATATQTVIKIGNGGSFNVKLKAIVYPVLYMYFGSDFGDWSYESHEVVPEAGCVPVNGLWVYMYSDKFKETRYYVWEGKLYLDKEHKDGPHAITYSQYIHFWFSHRDDMHTSQVKKETGKTIKRDFMKVKVPVPTKETKNELKIYMDVRKQDDWVFVIAEETDGARPDVVKMANWKDNYTIGINKGGKIFLAYGKYTDKDKQEKWKIKDDPITLINIGNVGDNIVWGGTMHHLSFGKIKVLLNQKISSGEIIAGTYNDIGHYHNIGNYFFTGRHFYNKNLVTQLEKIPRKKASLSELSSLPGPDLSCMLPGDICWHEQDKQNCGAFSFASAMNYWYPYTNNPLKKNGKYYDGIVPKLFGLHGARTPDAIAKGGKKCDMVAVDYNLESIEEHKAACMNVLKLWICAGVPVLVLVKEGYKAKTTMAELHWKTLVGYDAKRLFFINTGADNEYEIANRSSSLSAAEYEHAPVGNDVDAYDEFYEKWSFSGDYTLAEVTSVDAMTFVPVYPNDSSFGAKERW